MRTEYSKPNVKRFICLFQQASIQAIYYINILLYYTFIKVMTAKKQKTCIFQKINK